MTITLYTMPQCPHCERAKSALDASGIEYDTICIPEREKRHEFYDAISSDMKIYPEGIRRTMPKLKAGEQWVPSANDIVDMVRFGLL